MVKAKGGERVRERVSKREAVTCEEREKESLIDINGEIRNLT